MAEDKKLSPLEALDKKHARETAERAAKIEAAANDLRAAEEMVREGEAQACRPAAREGHRQLRLRRRTRRTRARRQRQSGLNAANPYSVTVVRFLKGASHGPTVLASRNHPAGRAAGARGRRRRPHQRLRQSRQGRQGLHRLPHQPGQRRDRAADAAPGAGRFRHRLRRRSAPRRFGAISTRAPAISSPSRRTPRITRPTPGCTARSSCSKSRRRTAWTWRTAFTPSLSRPARRTPQTSPRP